MKRDLINWLLQGDVAIQYQTHRDLIKSAQKTLQALQKRIRKEGWGVKYIRCRNANGHWGRGFYQPKWTNTHYTLLDLKNLGITPDSPEILQTLKMIFDQEKGHDGGINPSGTIKESDVCLNGMVLNYASYFGVEQSKLNSVVDFILSQQMKDGGFNCRLNRSGAVHSSLHSTLSVIEGILEYSKNRYRYKLTELKEVELVARKFILQHRLYKSDRTGEIIDKKMLMLSYPSRWRYDILRALDYFRAAGLSYDPRMDDAFAIIAKKRRADGTWPLQAKHPGEVHFEMEKPGKPSRWNTLRVLRIKKHFNK